MQCRVRIIFSGYKLAIRVVISIITMRGFRIRLTGVTESWAGSSFPKNKAQQVLLFCSNSDLSPKAVV